MEVRPYRSADEDAVLALWAQMPEFVPAPIHRGTLRLGGAYDIHVVAMDGERIAAYGAGFRPPWATQDGIVFVRVSVDSDHRGDGRGSRMWEIVRAGLGPAKTLMCAVSDLDERSLHIAQHWGFEAIQHPIESAITWTERPSAAVLPDGYRFEMLDDVRNVDRPDLDRLLSRADTSPESAVIGVSQVAGFAASSYPVLALVVHDAAGPAGAIFVTGEGTDADVLLTAVHPDHRRRGLARALKQEMHREAFERGFRRLATSNEASNTGIRALNREMGYVRVRGAHRLRLDL
ncbi:GNAT family N-acetyltransferase [Microbacterium hominis]|uniref:GNAT family N-acetyltransferase n=1 Tax=Microbacterium hominis TaxID=162426 RepID=A0A7D4QJ72_9MICO|nr:GNAT family N-acetyltransferase [Microbacterium hominis]QKJ19716.1 GNAT family N-acetyltransferase [Microbacterium hominis]